MLIGKQNVYLFAGAGVVSGSDAMIELNEIEKKMTVSL
jgi:isochorismate synthase EntC